MRRSQTNNVGDMSHTEIFSDRTWIAHYADDTARKVPGFADLHRMTMLLLAEHAPDAANILVLGAGGGLELSALANAQPRWHFVGVDPSVEMLDLAKENLGPLMTRVQLQQGYIESAPSGPFDGATCLLTLHFLQPDERLRSLRELHRRLKPSAPLVVAHHCSPEPGQLSRWLSRSVAFADKATAPNFEQAHASAIAMEARLSALPAEQDEELLREAGFSNVALFYAGFTFRGWVAAA